jgi:hypothetical protein
MNRLSPFKCFATDPALAGIQNIITILRFGIIWESFNPLWRPLCPSVAGRHPDLPERPTP